MFGLLSSAEGKIGKDDSVLVIHNEREQGRWKRKERTATTTIRKFKAGISIKRRHRVIAVDIVFRVVMRGHGDG
jgi:hypothetical protein